MKRKCLAGPIIRPRDIRSCPTRIRLWLAVASILFLAGVVPQVYGQDRATQSKPDIVPEPSSRPPRTYTSEGISVEFGVDPLSVGGQTPADLLAGAQVRVRFKILDANGGQGLPGLRPTAWIDRREAGRTPDAQECRAKIQSFLQPSFSKRATIDLNAYFVLALNHEPNISVIDPLSGFGGSNLYTLVPLASSGEDWVMSTDQKRLYVSMPQAGQVAVIDTTSWKVIASIDAGAKPMSVALQRDGKYLWVGNDATEDASSGITAIDTATLTVAAQLKTGAGHHDIAFTEDDSVAFVTNKQSGTVSAIDVRKLAMVAEIKVGALPSALAFSPLSKALYVANEGDGTIVAVDALRLEIVASMKAQPGLRAIRTPLDGRFGFAVNRATDTVHVFDVSTNRLVHVVPVGPAPDQIVFTRQFAYVHSTGSEFVTMIRLADLGNEAAVSRFPAGQKAPRESPANSLADAIVPAPEAGAVLVANPADKMIYFYTEGMAAPMGSFQNYRRDPKALLVLENGLRESERGVYTTTVRLAGSGHYDVAFLLDSPRLVNCFDMTVAENPELPKPTAAIRIEPLPNPATARAGQRYSVRVKVTDPYSNKPNSGLQDVGALVFLAPGIWQTREPATPIGDGVYEIHFVPPQSGVYYVFFQCPSLNVQFNHMTPLTLQAIGKDDVSGARLPEPDQK